ncbi:MAG: hypothetical protein HC772_18020 [Leptolyngbyaceae cyanobacterium CRU_2_3]|nr:hypothetical protein [Leptolyngbyaceae cyanobacterium CRU_2_3]
MISTFDGSVDLDGNAMKTANLVLLTFFVSALFSGALVKAIQMGLLTQAYGFIAGAIGGLLALAVWFTWLSLQPTAPLFLISFVAGTVLGVL